MKFLRRLDPPLSLERFAKLADAPRMSVQRLVNGERWRHLDINVLIPVIRTARSMGARLEYEDFAKSSAVPLAEARLEWGPRPGRTGTDG